MQLKNSYICYMKIIFYIIFFIGSFTNIVAQQIYKTPSGKRYHLSSCRMVKNVSKEIHSQKEIKRYHLTPCKICKPPPAYQIQFCNNYKNKAVGSQKYSVQCKGYTKKGTRCKHKTHIANGYCFQHQAQAR